ncbi:MAG: vanadium-dependent haloperoxidase [Solirubrobacteraceae bacterium]
MTVMGIGAWRRLMLAVVAWKRGGHARTRRWLAACAGVLVLAPLGATPTASAATTAGDPTVISDWNALAATTVGADPTKAPQETPLYVGFVQAAVYDAVVGIDRRYEPYRFDARAPHRTSAQAAAVAAAHKVLVTYSPYAQATLDAAYAAALAQIPDGKAKTRGIAFGTLAADNLIAMRANDGRNALVLFTQPPAPGVWRPTPPALLPMAVPWMGSVTPLLVRSGAQFGEPGPPPALTSARYTRDFDEVKALGSATSTARTPEQTNSALFFSGNAAVQFNAALRDQMTVRHPDIVDAARMFAAVDMSEADAIISVWHAKYLYGFWRPITAINLADTDGNPATTADRNWTPLLTTPPYPDYVSGYSGLTGAFTQALEEALDTRHLQLTLTSTAVPGAVRSYDSGKSLRNDVVDARVWLGIHFRTADTGGVEMGQRVADWALTHYFGAREDH